MFIYVALFFSLFVIFSEDKSLKITEETVFADDGKLKTTLNAKKSFEKIKTNESLVLLVGNNDYNEDTGFSKLNQCINDIILLQRIFINCAKFKKENIYLGSNLTKSDFITLYKNVISKLKPDQGFILTYSGHGDTDGSLVFIDGERLSSEELKKMVNSIKNDTVLILDSCYSGNNDGPFDREGDTDFKSNCLRLYSSLAHLTSKEITYDNDFFTHLNPFYKSVLNINISNQDNSGDINLYNVENISNIDGNGYFISFIGYFFAEYDFSKKNNINFKDILHYITNKSKQYVEYLALKGARSKSLTVKYYNESAERLNQQPKVFPLAPIKNYQNPNNEYLVIFKYVEPIGIKTEFITGGFIGIGDLFKDKYSPNFGLRIIYSPKFFKGFLLGNEASYYFLYREENRIEQKPEITSNMIAIYGRIGYLYNFKNTKNFLSLGVVSNVGINIAVSYVKNYDYVLSQILTNYNFIMSHGLVIELNPHKLFSLQFGVNALFFLENNQFIYGINIPLSFGYNL